MYCPWQDGSTVCAQIYIYAYTQIHTFVHIFSQEEAWPLCSLQAAHWWVGFGNCALTQKFTHQRQGQAHPSPLLHSASALQIRRQTGNESSCALANELIILHHHCQFCFCSSWSQHLSGSGHNFRVATRTFQEDVFLDKCKVRKYFSTQLGFSLSPLF